MKIIPLNKNKSPVGQLKDIITNSCEDLENAGVLLNKNTALIDFDGDNKNETAILEYLEKKYPTALIVTTDKGKHFYFSKPVGVEIKNWTDTITVGGFQVDYKTGDTSYAVIKRNGIERERNRELTLEGLPELPPILYPLTRQKENLSGMKDGDGRNSAIFRHLGFVRRAYPEINIDEISEIINAVTFEDSLDEKELKSVVESAKKYEYDVPQQKDLIKLAQFLITELEIKMYNNQLYFKQDNKYISDNRLLLKRINDFCKLKRTQDTEIIHQINKFADEINTTEKELPIILKNGIILDGEFMTTDKSTFSPFFLNVSFDASAYDEHVDKFLNDITCERPELRKTLEEILGLILLTSKFPHHVFFFVGDGYNGKSTFLEMINNFVGELGANISLDAFNDATSVASLIGKLVNCTDETDGVRIDKCKGFKSLASGNTITVRPIYSKPVKVQNTATLILSSNNIPKFTDKTNGFYRRLVIIPFDFKITEKISDLDELLSIDNAKSYILNLALNGVKSIKENGYKITKNEILEKALEEYKVETDHVAGFVKEYSVIDGKETKVVFSNYLIYCGEIGQNPLSLHSFTNRLKDFGYKSTPVNKKGKTVRVYKKI